jgi:hypothetical protein
MNNLATPLAPSIARPNVVEGTYGFELRRSCYCCITEITRIFISARGVIIVEEREKICTHKSSTTLTTWRKSSLCQAWIWRNVTRSPEWKNWNPINISNREPCPPRKHAEWKEWKERGTPAIFWMITVLSLVMGGTKDECLLVVIYWFGKGGGGWTAAPHVADLR